MFILNSINYGYKTGSLSITQKQGMITCLPRPNKSPFYLKNWRPISLLNVMYKLASSIIASRLKNVLPKRIHEDQKGFIAGRIIGENIRLIYDILSEKKNSKKFLAFNFLSIFINILTLYHGNLLLKLSKWFRIMHSTEWSYVLLILSSKGLQTRGPNFPIYFILCAEVLSHMIRKDTNIKGIVIQNNEFKLSQYADDTHVF